MKRTNVQLDPTRTGSDAARLEKKLRSLIVGQDEAIEQVVKAYQTDSIGLAPGGRPISSLLFLGPTGSGKTRMVEATAECLLGNPRAVIKIDCAEFQHSHEISKLIGSPPGYLGHRETQAMLNQENLHQYHTEKIKISFVLFDEIEKASDALWNLLLGILDKGTLTLGDNRRVSFVRSMIFMTSNLGAAEMSAMLDPKLGFQAALPPAPDEKLSAKVSRSGVEAARRKFSPEFMNRIDKVVTFAPLGAEQLGKVLDIELKMLQERITNSRMSRPFLMSVSDTVKALLLQEGTDLKYGARHLKRAIERLLVQPLSNLIATDQILAGDNIRVDCEGGQASFVRESRALAYERAA